MANKMVNRKEVASNIVYLLPTLMRRTGSDIRANFPNTDPAHLGILMSLLRGACTVTTLSSDQAVSTATMSKSVDTLVDRGWVERKNSVVDRRKVELNLTADGCQQIANLRAFLEERIGSALGEMTDLEIEKLSQGLNLLLRVLMAMDSGDLQQSIKRIG